MTTDELNFTGAGLENCARDLWSRIFTCGVSLAHAIKSGLIPRGSVLGAWSSLIPSLKL